MSQKYGRTYHYPFSPGTTSDDRINKSYVDDLSRINRLVHTEKLDGENNCLNSYGVFARSHAASTESRWTRNIRERWELIRKDLGNIELFGENLYAVHSIEYKRLEEYYFIFAVRCLDKWLSWEEVRFYASLFDFPTVPEILVESVDGIDISLFENKIKAWAQEPSVFDSFDITTGKECSKEGIVSRNFDEFYVKDFACNVFKYVRKGHVKTDVHWIRNWKRAKLIWEY